MNFLKKKLKPLTSGLTNANQATGSHSKRGQASRRDLEEDLYDEYVVEAPPHPSELLALGVEPSEIDATDPDKLRELYKRALEEGKDKKTNSLLLARQRQKEELEEKKRTREEWKYFESLTTRVEQVVKSSQRNLDHWKETSAVDQLAEPDYELRQTADEVFKPVNTIKIEKEANHWIDFDEDQKGHKDQRGAPSATSPGQNEKQVDESGCPLERRDSLAAAGNAFVVEELLEDFGIDLRTEQQKRALEEKQRQQAAAAAAAAAAAEEQQRAQRLEAGKSASQQATSKTIDIKAAARPRPRPRPAAQAAAAAATASSEPEVDPFDTSFVAPVVVSDADTSKSLFLESAAGSEQATAASSSALVRSDYVDPFDTSHVNL